MYPGFGLKNAPTGYDGIGANRYSNLYPTGLLKAGELLCWDWMKDYVWLPGAGQRAQNYFAPGIILEDFPAGCAQHGYKFPLVLFFLLFAAQQPFTEREKSAD